MALDPKAVAFFFEHAGTAYRPDSETELQGRIRGAMDYARAEAKAQRRGITFEWADDWEIGNHKAYHGDDSAYSDGEPETCEWVRMLDANGDVIGSLGCVDDASAEYRRVIEAELADEVVGKPAPRPLPAVPADFPVRPLSPSEANSAGDPVTCGDCGRTWDDAIATSYTPAPSARCPFEYFHAAR